MSYMGKIETGITANLIGITGISPEGWTYYSETGQVDIYDNALATAKNDAAGEYHAVNHVVEYNDTGVEPGETDISQDGVEQSVVIQITSTMSNIGNEDSARKSIRERMNELQDDLLHSMLAGGRQYLGGVAFRLDFAGFSRDYVQDGNNIQSGKLISQWRVYYSQSINNPDQPSCGG